MKPGILRIAVIGPESSGKSELCEKLAAYFQTVWVPEYSREYLSQIQKPYDLEDIVAIYKKQFQIESELLADANKIIFVDTEFIIAKVWCEEMYGYCPNYINNMIVKNPYDFYLLTAPDLPWVYDPLRENPGRGNYFFEWYEELLIENNLNYGIVKGSGKIRLANAVDLIKNFLEN